MKRLVPPRNMSRFPSLTRALAHTAAGLWLAFALCGFAPGSAWAQGASGKDGGILNSGMFMLAGNNGKTNSTNSNAGKASVRTYKLTASVSGSGSVIDNGGQIACLAGGNKCSGNYVAGAKVALTAAPASGYNFIGWSGDCAGAKSSLTATVTMDAARKCGASFARANYTLAVSLAGTGSGSVSDRGQIDCTVSGGSKCSGSYPAGSSVTLTAKPAAGNDFLGWSGNCAGAGTNFTVQVPVNAPNLSCSARFEPTPPAVVPSYTLTVNVESGGSVSSGSGPIANCTVAGGSACTGSYAAGATVRLDAAANADYTFAGWSGDCAGSGLSTNVTMNQNRSCTAQFKQTTHTLTVSVVSGSGGITDTTEQIVCSSADSENNRCSGSYTTGDRVTLTAMPLPGYTFAGWGGDCSGSDAAAQVTIGTKGASCTAWFEAIPVKPSAYTLLVTVAGSGSVTDEGNSGMISSCSASGGICSASYEADAGVTLTATANAENTFTGWSGDCAGAGSSPTASVAMNAAHSCTATFAAAAPPPSSQQLRGVAITMMDPPYTWYNQSTGPVAGTHYPALDTRLIDYYKAKGVSVIRLLFAWEGMQPTLNGSIPSTVANYQTYFNNYKRIVDYATSQGIQVFVTPWQAAPDEGVCGACWRGQLVGSPQVPTSAFADFWGKMASIFKSNAKVSYVLTSEPNHQSTKAWFQTAQAAITAIRNAGSTQRIYVPGMSYTGASVWTSANYWDDPDRPGLSNAAGWLTANNGQPLSDPLNNIAIEVHTYLDNDESGNSACISSATAAADHMKNTVDWARAHGLKVYLGEIGFWAGFNSADKSTYPSGCKITGTFAAPDAWANFIKYFNANADTFEAYTWWAGSDPSWWSDVAANGGGHFSVSPTNRSTYTGDTVNMQMIQSGF